MQPTTTRPNDPLAILVVYALLALMAYAGFKQIEPTATPAQAQSPYYAATPTPALPTAGDPAFALIAPTSIPAPEAMPADAPAPIVGDPVDPDVVSPSAPQNGAGDVALPDNGILQATIEAPAVDPVLNDPNLNGGSVAPEGCPFPIVNGVCANGVLAKSIDESLFGQKSIADTGNDPGHVKARTK